MEKMREENRRCRFHLSSLVSPAGVDRLTLVQIVACLAGRIDDGHGGTADPIAVKHALQFRLIDLESRCNATRKRTVVRRREVTAAAREVRQLTAKVETLREARQLKTKMQAALKDGSQMVVYGEPNSLAPVHAILEVHGETAAACGSTTKKENPTVRRNVSMTATSLIRGGGSPTRIKTRFLLRDITSTFP